MIDQWHDLQARLKTNKNEHTHAQSKKKHTPDRQKTIIILAQDTISAFIHRKHIDVCPVQATFVERSSTEIHTAINVGDQLGSRQKTYLDTGGGFYPATIVQKIHAN